MASRQAVTLSQDAWEVATFEQRFQAMRTALQMALDQADRFELFIDVLSQERRQALAAASQWAETIERHDSLRDLPRPLRLGCGCLGVLLTPLEWLGIAERGIEYRLQGPLTPQATRAILEAVDHYEAHQLRLYQDDGLVWESYDEGETWFFWVTPEMLARLAQRLRPLVGVKNPLDWMPEEGRRGDHE